MKLIFLHGLESSSRGTKARWFRQYFPEMILPDFTGLLEERMNTLQAMLVDKQDLIMVGSSFGGLMATLYAQENKGRVKKVILLAPALNFLEASKYSDRLVTTVHAHLFIGRHDTVCPPDIVIPLAKQIFKMLDVHVSDDDHLLHNTFFQIDWTSLLKL